MPVANLVGAENSGFAQIGAGIRDVRTYRPCGAGVFERPAMSGHHRAVVPRPGDVRPAADLPRQSVQNTLAEMARRIDVARVYSHHVVERQLFQNQPVARPNTGQLP